MLLWNPTDEIRIFYIIVLKYYKNVITCSFSLKYKNKQEPIMLLVGTIELSDKTITNKLVFKVLW